MNCNSKEYYEWIESLKVGDEVYYDGGFWNGKMIKTIVKITPSGLFKIGNEYIDKSGQIRGTFKNVYPVTQKVRDEVEFKLLSNKISPLNFSLLTLDQLRRIDAIVNEKKEG